MNADNERTSSKPGQQGRACWLSTFSFRDYHGAENEMDDILNWDAGEVTVTDEGDGTFMVRIDGEKVSRWPSKEIAEKRAAQIRSHQPAK